MRYVNLFLVVMCIRLKEVRIPPHVAHGDSAVLICNYELEGDYLYSVKWYHEDEEFYRYVPRDQPPAQVFPNPGINVQVSSYIRLKIVNINFTGLLKFAHLTKPTILRLIGFPNPFYFPSHQNFAAFTILWLPII